MTERIWLCAPVGEAGIESTAPREVRVHCTPLKQSPGTLPKMGLNATTRVMNKYINVIWQNRGYARCHR